MRSYAPLISFAFTLLASLGLVSTLHAQESDTTVRVTSPDQRNVLQIDVEDDQIIYRVYRDDHVLVGPSPLGLKLGDGSQLTAKSQVVKSETKAIDDEFTLPWGKTTNVVDRAESAVVSLKNGTGQKWQLELRAYDDGVAWRIVIPEQDGLDKIEIAEEATRFDLQNGPRALYNTLPGFVSSHETLYNFDPIGKIPAERLVDCPILFVWESGPAAAITEADVFDFAGMYLVRPEGSEATLETRLSPHPQHKGLAVVAGKTVRTPWRVVLLGDHAGELLESNLLLCLNEPPKGDFDWVKPGKTSFHWWNGEFEQDYKQPGGADAFVARHKAYIDFCAENNIPYHGLSGDGLSWYPQSSDNYGIPSPDADVRKAREELRLDEIFAYAKERGVRIRLWVHWKPLAEHLDEAFAQYEEWGVAGLMVDFLNRDDQEMIDFSERMLESAARHKLHLQIHGSSKYSGEQRTWPNLLNREGVLNLEYLKWSDKCTPDHSVNVAYTRALAGPVDYHSGGFRHVSRKAFKPQDLNPTVLGTRCHHLALYVVYENPMPMVADVPSAYEGQPGFDFLREVPTTWDETKFVAGEPGEYVVLARRSGDKWYLAGITDWTERELEVPLAFLGEGEFELTLWADGSMDEAKPSEVAKMTQGVSMKEPLKVKLAPGGGFMGVITTK